MTQAPVSAITGLPEVVGRYRIKRLLGRGSFAVVALAWDEELESAVALKILHTRNIETENKFLEEARMLRRVQSLNVIAVHDIGRMPDGSPYFVLDYASHGTLSDRLEAGIAGLDLVSIQSIQLLNFIDGLTDGLTAIHRAGLVHRDIKPANILFCGGGLNNSEACEQTDLTESGLHVQSHVYRHLLAEDEKVLVGDLGIAKDLSKNVDHSTLVGGTPFYLAPEQAMPSQSVTRAADIYSATALLWRMLMNETPPTSSTVDARLETLPENFIEQGWQSLIKKGMAADATQRYQTMDEWRWAVHDVLGESSSTVLYKSRVDSSGEPRTDICPYKGLAGYEESDSAFFCGRDALISQLLSRLQLEPVLVVGGPSGSGKSSLVRAGLVPLLKKGGLPGSEHWHCLLMTPGLEPVQALKNCLEPCGGLSHVMQRDNQAESPMVLIIDQFEEIFTLAEDSEKNEFLQILSNLTSKEGSKIKVTIAVRADFYTDCAREPWLAAKITSNQVLVGPMTPLELRQAISEPALRAGYIFEKGLVSSIIEEAGNESGSLPLVAHALVETWVRRFDRTLTLDGFRACGGVAGAISQSADATYEHQLDVKGREATRSLMLNLVNPGDGSPDTRRVVDRDDILHLSDNKVDSSILEDVIRKLTSARLLTVDDTKVQIAHEALLRNWPRLRNWIDESRDDLRMRRRISLQAEQWQSDGQESDLLYRGIPLFSALDWREANPNQLGVLENTFLDTAQRRHNDNEELVAKGRKRTRRLLTAGITLLTLLAVGATLSSIFAYRGFKQSQHNAQVAQEATAIANVRYAGALGAAAYGQYAEDPRLSLVVASEALARTSSADSSSVSTFDTRAAMVSARQVLARGGAFLLGSPIVAGDALTIGLSPMGSILAIGSVDGEVSFIDVATHNALQPGRTDHDGGVRDLDFSPDGKSMVSVGSGGRILLWQPDSNGIWTSTLLGQSEDVIQDVDFHPGGKFVATGNHDATVGQWYIDGSADNPTWFSGGLVDMNTLAFSPDGRFLVAANADKTIIGWNIDSGEVVMGPLKSVHASHLLELEFSPSANHIFTMTTDGESKMLSFPEGEFISTLFGGKETVGAIVVNTASGELIGGTNHGQLTSWDIESGSIVQRSAAGHSQIVKDMDMTHDERLIATLGRDQQIRFWTINDNYPMGQQLLFDAKAAKSVAISPDGSLIASGGDDGSVKLWRLNSNDAPKTLTGHTGQVWALTFSSDNRLLASADRLGNVKVWDVIKQRVIQIINTGNDAIWSVEFFQNDTLFVATDSGVSKYSISDGQLLNSWDKSPSKVTRLTLSPDKSKIITTYNDGDVALQNTVDDADRKIFNVGDDLIWSAVLNGTSTILAAASSDETVSLIDIQSGQRIAKLTGHQGGATNVAFLGDGTTLVVTDRRGSLHWWDIQSRRRLAAPWRGHRKSIWRLAMHPDGDRFATAGDDGKVWIWDTMSVTRACEIGFPSFDTEQKKQYLGIDHSMQACR